ncbi:MAG TPA: hypothetical protein VEL76_11370 [Gemmataceae bacterium]|nr:hypothetical protein [Gemmataceae bacterium]
MTCDTCQRRLLASERPDAPRSSIRRHLADCPACRAYQRQLLRIERHVPLLPVPSSRGKKRLLTQLLGRKPARSASEEPAPAPAALPLTARWQNPQVRLVAAAAAVFLVACGVYLGILLSRGGNDDQATGPDPNAPKVAPNKQPLLEHVADYDVRLAEADTPRKRVETLAELADALHRETHTLTPVAPVKDLQDLASLYEQVIRDGVVPRAKDLKDLPEKERRAVLDPIRAQLARVEVDARRLAQKASSAAPLLQMAAAAKKGDQQLRALMEETQ